MNIQLYPYTAMVCGSTQGIGKACAFELASMGARIVLVARDADKLNRVIQELPNPNGVEHESIIADFSNPEQLRTAMHAYFSSEERTVNILVNNTGGPASGKASDADTGQFMAAFQQHLICNHILATACIPGMKKSGYGRIINIISTSVKAPLPNLGVSNTIRAAVANWSKTLANELGAFGITVNNVLPGATKTERLTGIISANAARTGNAVDAVEHKMLEEIPMKRFGAPEEIANAVAFLSSPAAAYINGINLPVDGGRTASL